jgi:hypothetical protein
MQFRETTNGLGGAATVTQVSATAMNNIFDDVSAAEAAAGDTEYRAIDVYNDGASAVTGVDIYMSIATSSADSQLDMGAEAAPLNSTTSIANESTAPVGVTFANRTSGAPLSLPDIPAGEYARVWLRRAISAAATNTSNDQGTIEVVYA